MNDNQSNPFGILHFKLARSLYKQKQYSQILFNLYVSCRANIPDWQYSKSDIGFMTGLHNTIIKKHCEAFVDAGIFIEDGKTRNGSPCYKLDGDRFKVYLAYNPSASDPSASDGLPHHSLTCQPVTHQPVMGYPITLCYPSPSLSDGLAHHSALPNNKEYKKEEKEDTHTRRVYVCASNSSPDTLELTGKVTDGKVPFTSPKPSLEVTDGKVPFTSPKLPSPETDANDFVTLVKALQTEYPEYGISLDRSVLPALSTIFSNHPYTPAFLYNIYECAVSNAFDIQNLKVKVKRGQDVVVVPSYKQETSFDPFFHSKRAKNLAYFAKHHEKIQSENSDILAHN